MKKSKLLYIRPSFKTNTTDFIKDFVFFQREKIFYNQFDVVLIEDTNINYEVLLSIHQPDITLMLFTPMFQKELSIENIIHNDNVARIAFIPADGFSTERHNIITFHETIFKPHAYFSSETTYGGIDFKYLSDKFFYFPWSIDKEKYKNYGLSKLHNIILLGHNAQTYPWRTDIFPIIEQDYDFYRLEYPKNGKGIYGSDFSKIINQSVFAPTCGGYTDALVRKHFEIPASYCCLITEKTEATLQAGFVDMENCLFMDKETFREKMNFLLANPQKVQEITQKGYDLVLNSHTDEHRTQILDWYYLFKEKKDNQHIIQSSLFAKLTLANDTSKHYHQTINKYTQIRDEANHLLFIGDIAGAYQKYLYCHQHFLNYSVDILTMLTLVELCLGKFDTARWRLKDVLYFEVQNNLAPDIIEYSLFLLSCLLYSKERLSSSKQFMFFSKIGQYRWYDYLLLIWALIAKEKDIALYCAYLLSENNYKNFNSTHSFFNIPLDRLKYIFSCILKHKHLDKYTDKAMVMIGKAQKTHLSLSDTFVGNYDELLDNLIWLSNYQPPTLKQKIINQANKLYKQVFK